MKLLFFGKTQISQSVTKDLVFRDFVIDRKTNQEIKLNCAFGITKF